MSTIFFRDQKKKTSDLLCFINIFGLFIIGLSTLFAYFAESELFGVNSFLVIGIILVAVSAFIEKANRVGKIISVLIMILIETYYNLFSGDLFETANTKNIILTWISLVFLTGVWKFKLCNVQINAIKSLLILALTVLCLSYFGFRVIFPISTKVDFTNSNFIGLCAVLLAMLSLKYFDELSIRSSMTGIFCFLIAIAGVFASSSRFAIFVIGLLFVVAVINLMNPKHFRYTLAASFGVFVLLLSSLLIFGSDFGDVFSFIDDQFKHINNRLDRISFRGLSEDQRLFQVFTLTNRLEENFLFLFFPLHPDDYIAAGKGFSDNSLLELAGYIGFLPSIFVFVILGKRLFQQMTHLDALVILAMLLFFNVLLWVPFAALLYMYLLGFPRLRVYTDKNFQSRNLR
jgi:hypothetical protein